MPFGVDGAAVVGGVVAGMLLQFLAQEMRQRGLPMRHVVAFTIALGANPLYAFVALNDLRVPRHRTLRPRGRPDGAVLRLG